MIMSRRLRIRKNKYLEESALFDDETIIDDDSDDSDHGSLSYTKRRKILVYSKCQNSGTKLKKVSQIQEIKSSNNFKTIQLIFDNLDNQNSISEKNDSMPLKLHNDKVLQQNSSVQSLEYNQNRSNKCEKTQQNLESYDLSTLIEDTNSECFECIEQQTNSCLSPNLIIDDDEENQENNLYTPTLSQNISSLSSSISNNSDENKDHRILKQLIQQEKQKVEKHQQKVRYKSGGYFEKLNEILKNKKIERRLWYHERQVWENNNDDTKGIIENIQIIYGRILINIKLINNEKIIILMGLDENIEENLKIGSSVIVSLDNYVYNILNQVVRIPCYKIVKT